MEKTQSLEAEKVLETTNPIDSLQLRRSDHEDAKDIEAFFEESKRTAYTRIFASGDIMHFIETSYLSITVLTADGKVVAFASFDHSPIVFFVIWFKN